MRILVALDGSSYGASVTRVAIQIANAHAGSQLIALNIVNVRVASGNLLADLPGRLGFEPAIVSATIEADHVQRAEAIVGAFAREAEAHGLAVERVVRAGAIPQVLQEASADVDLVVMGVRGQTEDTFPGQGGRLLSNLPVASAPVLLVPRDVERVDSVLLGYDGSTAARHTARAVRSIAVALSVPIHGVFVSADGSGGEILDGLDQQLGVPAVRHVASGAPHAAIVAEAERAGVKLLALGFSGRSKLKDFLFGTLGERVILDGKFAVLLAS